MNSVRKRPTSVKLIGWIFIGLGVLGVYSASGLVWATLRRPEGVIVPGMEPFGRLPGPPKWTDWAYQWQRVWPVVAAGLKAVFSILAAAAGIQLLRLRAWARAVLEALCWLYLTYCTVTLICFVVSWIWWTDNAASIGHTIVFVVGYALLLKVLLTPGVALIGALRGDVVRKAFAETRAEQHSSRQSSRR